MEPVPLCLSSLRVLILNDSECAAGALCAALRTLGIAHVARAHDLGAGLGMLQAAPRQFDVAIFDLDVDGMDSIEFISRPAVRGTQAFILMSSHDEELQASVNAFARRFRVNILGVLSKPVVSQQLADLLSRYGGSNAQAMHPCTGGADPAWTRAELAKALESRQFIPFFQPQIELATNRMTSVEVLARWNHPELGVLPPSQFIDVMEDAGLLDGLFDTLLSQSLEFARQWDARGWPIGIAINVSPSTLQNTNLPNHVSELVRQHGVPVERVTLEVTETAMTQDPERLLETVIRLRLRGFKLSVDDFGTGYSSLQQLSEMPFTEIKIDRSLVSGALGSRKAIAILESIVGLANKLGMCTVAEGIECQRDCDLLLSLGCRFGQAYYFARPMGNAELTRHLFHAGSAPRIGVSSREALPFL